MLDESPDRPAEDDVETMLLLPPPPLPHSRTRRLSRLCCSTASIERGARAQVVGTTGPDCPVGPARAHFASSRLRDDTCY
ncbi:unnamed protein product [Protopolystoma xenopodis]|uniref:Uncharacterized protein n=1 Tax=Protopolystoma xenopodis TaxID=117903 RepID=A0A3S5BEC2_9PLAT|nr:unnamed protein product [Protopolystoma xenopodis]